MSGTVRLAFTPVGSTAGSFALGYRYEPHPALRAHRSQGHVSCAVLAERPRYPDATPRPGRWPSSASRFLHAGDVAAGVGDVAALCEVDQDEDVAERVCDDD